MLSSRIIRAFSSQEKITVAWFGLGNMGKFMTKNLSRHPAINLYGYDLNKDAEASCKDHLTIGTDPKEICARADFIITNITNTAVVSKLFVDQGYFDIVSKNAMILDTSTIEPIGSQQLTQIALEKGKTFIDCPMSGGVVGAEKGTLTFMCGTSSEEHFNTIEPLLAYMGKKSFNCKVPGGGQIAKACNNMALAIQMLSVTEALNLSARLGLDPKVMSDIMVTATSRCWSNDTYNPVPGYLGGLPADRDYNNGFGIDLVLKDLTISTEAAKAVNANVDSGLYAKSMMEKLSAEGYGNKDFGYLFKYFQENDKK